MQLSDVSPLIFYETKQIQTLRICLAHFSDCFIIFSCFEKATHTLLRTRKAPRTVLWNLWWNFHIDITIWMGYCWDLSTIRLALAFEMGYLTSLLQIVAVVHLSLLPAQVSIWAVLFFQLTCINYTAHTLQASDATWRNDVRVLSHIS